MSKITDKSSIGKLYYVRVLTAIGLCKRAKAKKCKKILANMEIIDGDDTSIIDPANNIFQCPRRAGEGHKFLAPAQRVFFIHHDDKECDIWIEASEVTQFLECVDKNQAIQVIRQHVQPQNMNTYEKLIDLFPNVFKADVKSGTIFINLAGFINLMRHSKKNVLNRYNRGSMPK